MERRLLTAEGLTGDRIKLFEKTDPARAYKESFPAGRNGRGTLRIGEFDGERLFIKREARGGLASLLLPGQFFIEGPFLREWELASWLAACGQTPRLYARWFIRARGLLSVYTVIEPCFDGAPVSDLLARGCVDDDIAHQAGFCIGSLHRMGVYHADLNISNILIRPNARAVAIDWRHSYRTDILRPRLRRRNVLRFVRSSWKAHHYGAPALKPSSWTSFCEGYAAGFGVAEDWLLSFKVKCRRPSRLWIIEWNLQTRLKRESPSAGGGSST